MTYLIDSDWFIDYLFQVPDAQSLVDPLIPAGIAISIITYLEAYVGVLRTPDPAHTEAVLVKLLQLVPVLPFGDAEARRCARLRYDLQKMGKRVRSRALDLLIATTALVRDLTLVTRNRDDYKDIPGLQLH